MARKRHRRGTSRGWLRAIRLNGGSMASAFHAPKQSGILDGVRPLNLTGVLPVVAGLVANNMLQRVVAGKIPYTRSGVGKYVLGVAGAGVIGGVAATVSPKLAKSIFTGAMVETLGNMVIDLQSKGVGAITKLSDDGLDGFGDFVSPNQINNVFPASNPMSQYSLPNTNAQMLPVPSGPGAPVPVTTPAKAMSDYQDNMVGLMVDDGTGSEVF